MLVAVKQDGCALGHASEELRIGANWDAIGYASEELRGDRELVLAAVKQNGYALGHASEELRGDRERCWHWLRPHYSQ